jgi:hypothetical protein
LAHLAGQNPCKNASPEALQFATEQKIADANKSSAKSSKHNRLGSMADASGSQSKKMRQTDLLERTFRGIDMPFSESEKDAFQAQSLRAVISANWSFRSFENPEVVKLFWMMRSAAPEILPSGKVVGGKLLNDAAAKVESNSSSARMGGSLAPKVQLLNGVCVNVNYKVPSEWLAR